MANKKETAQVDVIINGQKANASIKDMEAASRALRAQWRGLATDSPDFQKIASQISELNKKLSEAKSQANGMGSSFKKMFEFGGGMALFEGVKKGFEMVKGVFENTMNATKAGADQFEFAVSGMKNGVDYFWKTLATGDWSSFITGMTEAIKTGYNYAKMMDMVKEKTWALGMQEADMHEQNVNLELDLRNKTLSDDERIKAGQQRIKNEEILANKRTEIAKNAYDADLLLVRNRTKLSQAEIENVLKNFDEEKRVQAEKYIEYEKTLDYLKKLKDWQSQSAGMYQGQKPNLGFAEPEILKGLNKTDDKIAMMQDRISKTSPEVQQLAHQLESIGLAKENQIDNVVKSYIKLKDAAISGKEDIKKVYAQVSTLLAEDQKEKQKDIDAQKKYLEEIILMGVTATEKENGEFTQRLQKAGIYGVAKNKLTKDQQKALEILTQQHEENLNKIAADADAKKKTALDKWNNELLQLNDEASQQNEISLKEQYARDLQAVGDNADKRKAIEQKYQQDLLTLQLGELESRRQFMQALGMDTLKISEEIANKKLEIVNSGLKYEEKSEKDSINMRKQFGLQTLVELEAEELKKLQEAYEAKKLTTEEYEQALFNIKLKYSQQYVQAAQSVINSIGDAVTAQKDAELAELDTKQQKEKADLEAKYENEKKAAGTNKDAISKIDEKYSKKRTELDKKQQKEENELRKKYADSEFALKVGSIIANTAVAIMQAYAQLGPIAGGIAAIALGVTGASQISIAKAERDKIKQLAHGQYDVIGADDGQLYSNVPYSGKARTGIYPYTTLISEGNRPEMVIDNPTLRNIQFNAPDIIPRILAMRVQQNADGSFPNQSSIGNQQSSIPANDQQMMKDLALIQLLNKLNDRLNEPIETYMTMDQFERKWNEYLALKNDVTRS